MTEMETEPKELGAEHHATQTLTFADSMGEVKDEQPPGWSTATTDMKFEYLLYGHREQLACQVCGKTFLDESRLRYVLYTGTSYLTDAPGHHTCSSNLLSVPAGNMKSCIQQNAHLPVRSVPKLSPHMLT